MISEESTFIVAELSCNHFQDYEIALKSLEEIKKCGADAVKLQLDNPDGGITINCDNEYFKIDYGTIWDGKTLYELYKETYTPWEWHEPLKKRAEEIGLVCFSTPSCIPGVDYLEHLDYPMYKISSFEITDIGLIEYAASKGKPMIISTGIAQIGEIQEAVEACRRVGNNDITLLKCTSSYPAPIEDANLMTMVNMKETFNVKIGISDHSLGNDVCVAAVALGACFVEKHFILDRKMGGPDGDFSMEPQEFRAMVDSIRNVEKSLGCVTYNLNEKAIASRGFTKSLFVVADMKKGDVISSETVKSIRPGNGISPKYLPDILGRKVRQDISRGTPFNWGFLETKLV